MQSRIHQRGLDFTPVLGEIPHIRDVLGTGRPINLEATTSCPVHQWKGACAWDLEILNWVRGTRSDYRVRQGEIALDVIINDRSWHVARTALRNRCRGRENRGGISPLLLLNPDFLQLCHAKASLWGLLLLLLLGGPNAVVTPNGDITPTTTVTTLLVLVFPCHWVNLPCDSKGQTLDVFCDKNLLL